MMKEHFVACTKIIEAKFASGRSCKPVLWTFAMTGKSDIAFDALARQGIPLRTSKALLLGGCYKIQEGCLVDVSKAIFRIDVVIARVHIPVMFHRKRFATGF
jgi:hypothetical protein